MRFNNSYPVTKGYPTEILSLPIEKRLLTWLLYGERGISSDTICSALCGIEIPEFFKCNYHSMPDVPHDSSDFRRCYLLLKLIPEFRDRLHEIIDKYPKWKPYVENWSKMTLIFESDVDSDGWSKKLYDFMRNELK